jgi:hypothetical protein
MTSHGPIPRSSLAVAIAPSESLNPLASLTPRRNCRLGRRHQRPSLLFSPVENISVARWLSLTSSVPYLPRPHPCLDCSRADACLDRGRGSGRALCSPARNRRRGEGLSGRVTLVEGKGRLVVVTWRAGRADVDVRGLLEIG